MNDPEITTKERELQFSKNSLLSKQLKRTNTVYTVSVQNDIYLINSDNIPRIYHMVYIPFESGDQIADQLTTSLSNAKMINPVIHALNQLKNLIDQPNASVKNRIVTEQSQSLTKLIKNLTSLIIQDRVIDQRLIVETIELWKKGSRYFEDKAITNIRLMKKSDKTLLTDFFALTHYDRLINIKQKIAEQCLQACK